MSEDKAKVYMVPNQVTPNKMVVYDPKVCNGCIGLPEPLCVSVCVMDMLFPNPEKGKPPIVLYPDECCKCGCCVGVCPRHERGAIKLVWLIMHGIRWKRKATGEHFRVGMPNPPPPNTRPPVE